MSKNHENGKPKLEPDVAPLGPDLLSRLATRDKLNVMWNEGKLDQYKGEFVLYAAETIFAHGRNLNKILDKAEKRAKAQGVAPELLVYYFVPGE